MKTTVQHVAEALYQSGNRYHRDGDYEAFTARQRALWAAVESRSPRFRRMVSDALREITARPVA